jgi:hypothetical protein
MNQFFIPTLLHDGWVLYALDMMKKCIIILDPQTGTDGFSSQRIKLHDALTHKLIYAFFKCIDTYYTNWSCGNDHWIRVYPIVMADNFSRYPHQKFLDTH